MATPPPYPAHRILATMYPAILLFIVGVLFLALLRSMHRLCVLEAIDRSGAGILMDEEGVRFSNLIIAVLRRSIGIRFCQEFDTDISITSKEYLSANASHPPLIEDWEAVRDAALSSTQQHLCCRDPDEETPLHLFIQSVILSTFLRLFFNLPTTVANTQDVMWISSETLRADDRCRESVLSPDLFRLVKSSQNPSGVLALLSATKRVTLATVCTVESGSEKIPHLRRAQSLLRDPISPEPGVTRLVEKIKKSNPPVQVVQGGLALGPSPFYGTHEVDFVVPIDLLLPPTCITGSDGGCVSWLHKAALAGQQDCKGEEWFIKTTAIILSAIETEIRRGYLTIDGDKYGSDAVWEGWILRRLRV